MCAHPHRALLIRLRPPSQHHAPCPVEMRTAHATRRPRHCRRRCGTLTGGPRRRRARRPSSRSGSCARRCPRAALSGQRSREVCARARAGARADRPLRACLCVGVGVGVGVCEQLTRAASVSPACAFSIRVHTRCVCGVVSSVMGRALAPLMRQVVFVRARASMEVAAPLRNRAIPMVTSTFECLILRVPPHAGHYLLCDLVVFDTACAAARRALSPA